MTDRSSDNCDPRDSDPPPPPAMSAARHQHLLNLMQAYQSRNGGASIFDGLPDPQRNAAIRAAPFAAAPSVQRVDVAADIIARAQRQLEAAAPPVGMAPSLAAGSPQLHEENAVQARRQRSAAAPRVNVASVAAAAPPQHHNVPENMTAASPPPPLWRATAQNNIRHTEHNACCPGQAQAKQTHQNKHSAAGRGRLMG